MPDSDLAATLLHEMATGARWLPARDGCRREVAAGARWLLARDRRPAAPQDVLLDLARRRLGQFLDEVEVSRGLEVGHVVAGELAELVGGHRGVRLEHHVGVRRLAPALVRQPDHGHLL